MSQITAFTPPLSFKSGYKDEVSWVRLGLPRCTWELAWAWLPYRGEGRSSLWFKLPPLPRPLVQQDYGGSLVVATYKPADKSKERYREVMAAPVPQATPAKLHGSMFPSPYPAYQPMPCFQTSSPLKFTQDLCTTTTAPSLHNLASKPSSTVTSKSCEGGNSGNQQPFCQFSKQNIVD